MEEKKHFQVGITQRDLLWSVSYVRQGTLFIETREDSATSCLDSEGTSPWTLSIRIAYTIFWDAQKKQVFTDSKQGK